MAPIDLLTFKVHIRDDLELQDTVITDAIGLGNDPEFGSHLIQDSVSAITWSVSNNYAVFEFSGGYQYVPGDVGMASGNWPPHASGPTCRGASA